MINTKRTNQISNKKVYIKSFDIVLLSMVFTLLVVLITGLWVGTSNYKKKQLLKTKETVEILAENLQMQFDNYIAQKVTTLKGFTTFPEIYEMDREKQRSFIKGHSRQLGFRHIFVLDADGFGYYIEKNETKYQKNEPFYGGNATTITVCVSIYDENREKVGSLCGAFELNQLQELFEKSKMIQNGKSYLVNREGRYIAVDNMQKIYKKISIYDKENSDFSLVRTCFDTQENQHGKIIQDGIEYQTQVTYLQSYDWAIMQCIETEEIFKDLIYIDFGKYASLVIVICILLGLIRITIYWHKSERRSETDALTKCRNRASMKKLLKSLNKESKSDITIIYFDLNNFKVLNDTYGHDKGDIILCIFGNVLMHVFGKSSYVGRMGGDEFIVVIKNTSGATVAQLCNQVAQCLKDKSKDLEFGHIISTAYGYATRKRGSTQALDDIITKADEEMYKNKRLAADNATT